TDPSYNAACLIGIDPVPSTRLRDPSQCVASGFAPNPDFLSSLLPYDLSRGGRPYQFRGKANITQFAFFGQDAISLGNFTLNLGLRVDRYHGLTDGNAVQPRGAFSYLFKPTRTVLRGGYSH